MKMSKKGISPLIATVLILAFTVALAAIIMNWGTGFTKDLLKTTSKGSTANIACAQDVKLEITSACRDTATGGTYKIAVENNGNRDVVKFNVRMYRSPTEVYSDAIVDTLGPFVADTITTTIQAAQVKKIVIIPSIVIEGQTVTCSDIGEEYGDVAGSDFLDC